MSRESRPAEDMEELKIRGSAAPRKFEDQEDSEDPDESDDPKENDDDTEEEMGQGVDQYVVISEDHEIA